MSRKKGFRVGIFGATGLVGEELLRIFEQRRFPVADIHLFASEKSSGRSLSFKGRAIPVSSISDEPLPVLEFAFLAVEAPISRVLAPRLAEAGTVVIDKSSAFRLQPDVPLVIPEINGDVLTSRTRLIANPNCTTSVLALALYPIRQLFGLRKVAVASYQSVSGVGIRGVLQLDSEESGETPAAPAFERPIYENVIPEIGARNDRGYTEEETKTVLETRKILEEPDLAVRATCVRVPTRRAHGVAAFVETGKPVDLARLRKAYHRQPGVSLAEPYRTPLEAAHEDDVFVGRLRQESPTEVSFWAVGDNLRRGAALNAVLIAEYLVRHRLLSAPHAIQEKIKAG